MDLPEYEPSRFEDGVYTHEVVQELEEEHDCTITFLSKEPRHPCDWEIHVDETRVGVTGRRRTNRGNTVYQLTSSSFRELVRSAVD